jgi:hypothetical protein
MMILSVFGFLTKSFGSKQVECVNGRKAVDGFYIRLLSAKDRATRITIARSQIELG